MIDSYNWLLPSLKTYFASMETPAPETIPWTPLAKRLQDARIALVTTAGINIHGVEPSFDYEREQREPRWGDPTYRLIPRGLQQERVQAGHLHINNADILHDVNVALPVHRMLELERQEIIGSLAPTSYSFMGYQPDTTEWRQKYAPEVARRMKEEDVDAVLLTPV